MKTAELSALKQKVDLLALVQSGGVKLTRQGNDYVGLCPFHEEKEPSFRVTPSKNLFNCFGCGAAGSVIDFVMRREGLEFRQAVDRLLTQTGVVQRAAQSVPEPKPASIAPERGRKLLERVVAIYEKNFADQPEGRAYLEGRGITDAGLFTRHRIGYCNGKLPDLLPGEDSELTGELKALGVLLAGGRERFKGCVVFPVRDEEGNIVTLYGRFAGEGDARHFYLPGRPTGLWNVSALKTLRQAQGRLHSEVILVESVIDGLSVEMAGAGNVIAIQGSNGLGASEAELLKSHGVQRVKLLLDGDESGQGATPRLEQLLAPLACQRCLLPVQHDPNSYLVEHGPERLAELIAQAPATGKPESSPTGVQSLPDGFALTLGLRRYQVRGLEKGPRKLKATVRVELAGKLHVDTLDFYSARWRRQLIQDVTRVLEESPDTIEADILKLMGVCENHQPGPVVEASAAPAMSAEGRREAEAFGKSPDLIDQILADYQRCGLVGERSNKLLCYLAAISRKMDKPLAVLILSSSGAGKTSLQDAAMAFCPPEEVVKLTSLSGKALFYKEQSSLKHKVLALEEGEGMAEASYAIRNLVSAGELVIESTIKDLATGRLTTMENRVEGPTAVFITTTDPDTDPETKSRFFVTSIDESRQQTQAILEYQRQRQTLSGLGEDIAVEPVLRRHRNFQRLLQPVAVVNPYADQLRYGDDRLQSRRDQPKYLNLIKAVAFLRQLRKPVQQASGCPYIEVDAEDIALANDLANELLGHSLDELSRPGYELLMLLEQEAAKKKTHSTGRFDEAHHRSGQAPDETPGQPRVAGTFTRRGIRESTGWSHARVHRYLKELIELEYVVLESGRNGSLQTCRLCYNGEGKDGQRFILGLKPIEELTPCPEPAERATSRTVGASGEGKASDRSASRG